MAHHLGRSTLARLIEAQLAEKPLRAALTHLLTCAHCLSRLSEMVEQQGDGDAVGVGAEVEAEYDRVLDRAFAFALRAEGDLRSERAAAAEALIRADAARAAEAAAAAEENGRIATLGSCEALIERSRALRHEDPAGMLRFAELAALVAESLEGDTYGAVSVADARAHAWAELANARRVSDDLFGAEEALGRAVQRFQEGQGELQLLARLMDVAATLRASRRLFGDAFQLLDGVHRLYRRLGDRHLAGRALIKKGIYAGYANEPEQAVRLLARGLARIEPQRDPGLALSAAHDLAWWIADLGRFAEARLLLSEAAPLYDIGGGSTSRLRRLWLEGRIEAGLGHLENAEAALLEVRAGFAGLPYQQSLAALDLATVWVRQGRPADVLTLVEEMVGTFRALQIEREALAALFVLLEAARQERAGLELLQRVARTLKGLENTPAATTRPLRPM